MNVIFYQIVLMVFAILFILMGCGERKTVNRIIDSAIGLIMFIMLMATFFWKL